MLSVSACAASWKVVYRVYYVVLHGLVYECVHWIIILRRLLDLHTASCLSTILMDR